MPQNLMENKELTEQIREVLLTFPDRVLIKTLTTWVCLADKYLQYPDWSDEYRYALGYRIQSDGTQAIYDTFNDLHENEPAAVFTTWIEPSIEALRRILEDLSIEQFYHTIVSLAADALPDLTTTKEGKEHFLENLLCHLKNGREIVDEQKGASIVQTLEDASSEESLVPIPMGVGPEMLLLELLCTYLIQQKKHMTDISVGPMGVTLLVALECYRRNRDLAAFAQRLGIPSEIVESYRSIHACRHCSVEEGDQANEG